MFGNVTAMASGTGSFTVGAYWSPPVKPVNYNTSATWSNIAAANLDMVFVNTDCGCALNKTDNENGIANSYANGVKLLVTDSSLYGFQSYTAADYAALDAVLTPYKNDFRAAGAAIKDEPYGYDLEGYANTYKHAKATAPALQYYVNLLPNTGDYRISRPPGKLVLSNSGARDSGSFVTSTHSLGQTLKVPAGITYIDGIDLYLDSSQWSAGEVLTLNLWTSPAKSILVASKSLTGTGSTSPGDYYPYFNLNTAVTAGATYYIELTHNGGGNNSVGWVIHSSNDVYPDGSAYESGIAQSYDFYFRMYTARDHNGSMFENYLDDWVNMSGADFIQYDQYPFLATSDDPNYFQTMELVRGRGLANNVKYGAFLQSMSLSGFRNPTLNEKRYNVYTYLTYGFKNMYWFTYWRPNGGFSDTPVDYDGTLLPTYTQIQTLNGEMRKLGGTLKDLTSQAVYHAGTLPAGTTAIPANFFVQPAVSTNPIIEGYFTNVDGRVYVMLTNRDYTNARTLDFNFNPKPTALTEISKTTGLEVSVPGYNAATGVLNITLAQGEGRLFALPVGYTITGTPPSSNLAIGATVSATSTYESSADGWGMSKVNDGQHNSVSGANGWTSSSNLTANHTESITLDMGTSKTVGRVDLYPRNDAGNVGLGFPIDFTIQVAANAGGPWTTAVTETGYSLPGNAVQSFTFGTPQSARYVKVEGTNLRTITTEINNPYRMQFAEIEIYDSGVSYTSAKDWSFNTDGSLEGWTSGNQISSMTVSGGNLNVTSTGTDPYIYSPDNLGVTNPAANRYIRIRMQNNTSNTIAQLFFVTTANTVWDDTKYVNFSIAPNSAFTDYVVDMGTNANWTGTIKQIRFDPLTAAGTVNVDYIRITN